MKIFGFTITKSKDNRVVDSVEVWTVSWYSRYGQYSGDMKQEFVPFFNKEDAEDFAESIKEAHKLLRNKNSIWVNIVKSEERR